MWSLETRWPLLDDEAICSRIVEASGALQKVNEEEEGIRVSGLKPVGALGDKRPGTWKGLWKTSEGDEEIGRGHCSIPTVDHRGKCQWSTAAAVTSGPSVSSFWRE